MCLTFLVNHVTHGVCYQAKEDNDLSIERRPLDALGRVEIIIWWTSTIEAGVESSLERERRDHNHEIITLPIPEEKAKLEYEIAAALGTPEPYEEENFDRETKLVGDEVYSFVFRYAPKGDSLIAFVCFFMSELSCVQVI